LPGGAVKTRNQIAQDALRLLVNRCPRLSGTCYWAGTSSIAIEELEHRESFDLDFHTVARQPLDGQVDAGLGIVVAFLTGDAVILGFDT